jgi:formylglycine-generating enzyme required for sulfatase activity
VVITARKAAHLVRDQARQKRGGVLVTGTEAEGLDEVLSREPTPEFATEMAEECQRLLACLRDRELEAVALWRMEGYSVDSQAVYSFGEPAELLERYGWFDRNSLGQPHPVALLKPNDLGLFDMHGNVLQWTHDIYNDKPKGKEDNGGELVSGASDRVFRGGGWGFGVGSCRAAYRLRYAPGLRYIYLGFRLARVPVEGK